MDTVQGYRKHAEECRSLAKQMKPGEQREQLLKMAETWRLWRLNGKGLAAWKPS